MRFFLLNSVMLAPYLKQKKPRKKPPTFSTRINGKCPPYNPPTTTMSTQEINPYVYPENATPLELARYMVCVMELAEAGERVEAYSGAYWFSAEEPKWAWSNTRYRIARPKIAEGYNPDGLTENQVGVKDGWRLLSKEELHGQFADETYGVEIVLGLDDDCWESARRCFLVPDGFTYRTKKPVGHYLPKPSPEPAKDAFSVWWDSQDRLVHCDEDERAIAKYGWDAAIKYIKASL